MGREPSNAPERSGQPEARDIDTFRPAADADAYSAETVVKAIPRELLADLAAALKPPGVPKVDVPRPAPRQAPATEAERAPIADELTPLGDDDATVIDRFDPQAVEEIPAIPSSGRGAPPPELTPIPAPPGDDDEDDDAAPVRALPIPLPAGATPLPTSARPLPAAAPPAPEQAPDIVDENTDFRAGTRWPWITALVFLVISFVVTFVVLKAF